jgi:hypothetical protein
MYIAHDYFKAELKLPPLGFLLDPLFNPSLPLGLISIGILLITPRLRATLSPPNMSKLP